MDNLAANNANSRASKLALKEVKRMKFAKNGQIAMWLIACTLVLVVSITASGINGSNREKKGANSVTNG